MTSKYHQEKIALADTQEFMTELMTDDSQSMCPQAPILAPMWAKLKCLQYPATIGLRRNVANFGRDNSSNENSDVFVFTPENCKIKYLERISKCHFTVEREAASFGKDGDRNYNPAILTCYGRNGMYVNDKKLQVGDKMILVHKDTIKLTRQFGLFEFYYQYQPTEVDILPMVCLRKYHIGSQIGSGGCGTVRMIHNLKTLEKFAMKSIKKETNPMVLVKNNNKILNEVNIMKRMSHVHVLKMIDFYETPERVIIVMDFMEGGNLLDRITQYDPNRRHLTEEDARFFFLQACRGVKYLHDTFVTHRDIKPDNILLSNNSPNAILKICDFGLSKLVAIDSMKTRCGTELYVAPEVLFGGKYTNKVDIWSMGCMLFAMLSGSVPFCEAYGPPDVQTQIIEARFTFERNRVWLEVSRTARDLIRRMLQKNPTSRPTVNQVLDHPWLRNPETVARVHKLYNLDDTMLDNDETLLELTLVKVSLNETPVPPPFKRRKVD